MNESVSDPGRPILTLVLPVRNAAGSLPGMLLSVADWVAHAGMRVEVIVVDDGSADGSRATAAAFGRRLPELQVLRHIEARGHLEAIKTAERVAAGVLVAFGREGEIASALESCGDLLGSILDGADVAALMAAPPGGWLMRAVAREPRTPELVLCRGTALRRILEGTRPDDFADDPDWLTLARNARCALSVVRRGTASATRSLHPARTA